QLLAVRHTTITDARRTALLQKAERAGDKVLALLTSILDTQQLDQQEAAFTPQPVDLRASVVDSVQLLDPEQDGLERGRIAERELRLNVPAGATVWGEPVRVRQILTNLLSNAIKYSPPGTAVEIAARMASQAPGEPFGSSEGADADGRLLELTV